MQLLEALNSIFLAAALLLCAASFARHIRTKSKDVSGKIQEEAYNGNTGDNLNKTAAEENDAHAEKNAGIIYNVTLAAVAAVGIIIRLWRFGSVPGGMNQDGAMAAVDVLLRHRALFSAAVFADGRCVLQHKETA